MSRSADDPNTAKQKIKPSVGHLKIKKIGARDETAVLSACFFFPEPVAFRRHNLSFPPSFHLHRTNATLLEQ